MHVEIHQCPKCDLRFTWQTELDDHCRTDHPEFHHDYPVGGVHHYSSGAEPPTDASGANRPQS
jgi:hypothetical protein